MSKQDDVLDKVLKTSKFLVDSLIPESFLDTREPSDMYSQRHFMMGRVINVEIVVTDYQLSGIIVGVGGRNAHAIRTILKSIAAQHRYKCMMSVSTPLQNEVKA